MNRNEAHRCTGCGRIDKDGAPDADGAWVCRRCWEEEVDRDGAPFTREES